MRPRHTRRRELFTGSLPVIVDLASQPIMWLVEAFLVSRIDPAALAAVGATGQVVIVTFTLLLTFIIGATWYAFAPTIFREILGAHPQVIERGVSYLRCIALFTPAIVVNFVALGIARGAGETFLCMGVNLGLNLLNVLLAVLLIFGLGPIPRLGVLGAGLALGGAHSTACIFTLSLLASGGRRLTLHRRDLTRPRWASFARIVRIGWPTTVEQMVWVVGQLIVMGFANRMGFVVAAAHILILRVQSILSMIYLGLGWRAMTLIGAHLGGGEPMGALRLGSRFVQVALAVVGAVALLLFLLARPLMRLGSPHPEVVALGAGALHLVAALQIPKALNTIVSANLRGVGQTGWVMRWTVAGVLLFEVLLAGTAGFALLRAAGPLAGLLGLWGAAGVDETLRALLGLRRYGEWVGGAAGVLHRERGRA